MKIFGFPIKTPYREGNTVVIYDSHVSKRFSLIVSSFGYFFIIVSFISLNFLLSPIIFSEFNYRLYALQNKLEITEEPQKSIVKYFDLIIPKIGVESTVFANIDPANEKEYQEVLSKGVAHVKGSFFPGENGSIFLFAHSTNYQSNVKKINAVFYLLKELEPEDLIKIIYRDKEYTYKVAEKKIVKPDDLSVINLDAGGERLILQTCWPPGTTWQRLLVIAYPIT